MAQNIVNIHEKTQIFKNLSETLSAVTNYIYIYLLEKQIQIFQKRFSEHFNTFKNKLKVSNIEENKIFKKHKIHNIY